MTSTYTPTDWFAPLRTIRSLGSSAERPGSLAGLHCARKDHLAQFFTPDDVAALLWRIVTPAIDAARARCPGSRVALFDNSVGVGRLLQFANPAAHELGGGDVHGPSVAALVERTEAAGFRAELHCADMVELRPTNYGVGLLNPPFSIHLDTPLLKPFPCTSWGSFGPNTSAMSHVYALAQALASCDVVVAVLPVGYAKGLADDPDLAGRLRAVIELPRGSFREEGTEVVVAVAVFGDIAVEVRNVPEQIQLTALNDPLPEFGLRCRNTFDAHPRLTLSSVRPSVPAVTLKVTGNATVQMAHDGRKVHLRFACALVQAKVMNALLVSVLPPREPSDGRYPKGIEFKGQGWFDLELYLAQPDPLSALSEFEAIVRAAGGTPVLDPGIRGYMRRRIRHDARARTPLRRFALINGVPSTGLVTATARQAVQCNPLRWGSGVFPMGAEVTFVRGDGSFSATHPTTGEALVLDEAAFRKAFDRADEAPAAWEVVHEGREVALPALAGEIRRQMVRTGAAAVASWGYQTADVVELRMAKGGVVGFQMALGKTRVAIALCLLGGERNLIVVEAHLVDELLDQLLEVGLSPGSYQVIRSPEACADLRRINIITYTRLRGPVDPRHPRRTYARLLRRRVATMVCDEAHLLRNPGSAQTCSVHMVSPKRRYAMTGTPVANYVRDLLPLAIWAGGDGTAVQPYGNHHPYVEPYLLRSMVYVHRGVDVFRERHVVTEWVTNEFAEDLRSGAKREVPKVANVEALRRWTAPLIKRRVAGEPDVAIHVRTPPHEVVHHVVPWDVAHLGHWLTIADDFSAWYRDMKVKSGLAGNRVNLVALLARIGAVLTAGNYPQHDIRGFGSYRHLTSKQRFAINRAVTLAKEGHKTLVYVENPGLANIIAARICEAGIEAIPFHGQMTITARNRILKHDFRRGSAQVLVPTLGVVQTGLNIPEASRGIFAARAWTTKTEDQARYRLLRPQQTERVIFETLELPGSLDTYQAMMLAFKADATNAAVDFLAPTMEDEEFVHLDTIIEQFVADLAQRRGTDTQSLRADLKHAA